MLYVSFMEIFAAKAVQVRRRQHCARRHRVFLRAAAAAASSVSPPTAMCRARLQGFEDAGYTAAEATRYATLSFFAGMVVSAA